ncbi:MAG: LacI family DNA-binding transcriptional regulator [Trueperaceae bacterium]|nr:LacI family DNA-binding transcriptional regulator [Trueperaceae bacterium]
MEQHKQRVTRQEVADRAKVSVAVVSYVINNGPRPVAPQTRARVEQAIAELGYYPNESARNLSRQNSHTIGLVIPSISNVVYAEIAEGLDSVCGENGYQLLILDSHASTKRERKLVNLLRSKQVDGVVMQPIQEPTQLIKPLKAAGIPTVLIDQQIPDVHCIMFNDFEGGQLATEHLLSLGHKRIAIIREKDRQSLSQRRYEGYLESLRTAGIIARETLVEKAESSHQGGFEAMQRLLALEHLPTAVFTHNDVIALGAMHAIFQAGLTIPNDISIVGYDDITSAAFYNPPLTTIRLAKHKIGQEAGKIIFDSLKTKATTFRTLAIDVDLVVRSSTTRSKG